MSQLTENVELSFSESGALARAIKGYQPREAQTNMAVAICDAIEQRHQLIVEAQTGTGKTFSYLVSAILSGEKTIVSTGTKALQ